MPLLTYNYDIDTPPETCEGCTRTSYIRRMYVTIIDCGKSIQTLLCDLWNNTRCANDDCYCNPFIVGDLIRFQFNLPVKVTGVPGALVVTELWNVDYFARLIDENGDPIPGFGSVNTFSITNQYGIGVDAKGRPFVWFTINTNRIRNICNFNVQISNSQFAVGSAPQEPPTGGRTLMNFFTEPYCCVQCDEPTLLVEGLYKKYDPFGGFYGAFNAGSFTGSQNAYQSSIRVYGNIEKVANNIEKTEVNNIQQVPQSVKVKIKPTL